MKKYNKPNLEIVKISPNSVIAAGETAGMSNWLQGNGLSEQNLGNITAWEYVSE